MLQHLSLTDSILTGLEKESRRRCLDFLSGIWPKWTEKVALIGDFNILDSIILWAGFGKQKNRYILSFPEFEHFIGSFPFCLSLLLDGLWQCGSLLNMCTVSVIQYILKELLKMYVSPLGTLLGTAKKSWLNCCGTCSSELRLLRLMLKVIIWAELANLRWNSIKFRN